MSFARFKHWFVNVFWYHYKWAALGSLAALVIIISVLTSIFGKREPDIGYMMVQMGSFQEEAAQELNALLTETFGDINGDGVPYYYAEEFDLRTGTEISPDVVIAHTVRLAGTISSHEMSLVFYAGGALDDYAEQVSYLDLEAYGINTGTDDPYRLEVTRHPAIQSAGFGGQPVYASVFAMVKNPDDPGELYEHQALALEVLRLLQSTL